MVTNNEIKSTKLSIESFTDNDVIGYFRWQYKYLNSSFSILKDSG